MYKRIAVPVDLAHLDKIDRALSVAADLAKHYGSTLTYIGVTTTTPSQVARTPADYAEKLEAFSASQSKIYGHDVAIKVCVSHDPAIDLDKTLLGAVQEIGADLVVMASHIPGLADYVWPSHGGSIATHSSASVHLVR